MINKQNLWFITLFSIIMVLSIYYLTMTDDTLATLNVSTPTNKDKAEVVINENDTLVALKVASEEAMISKISELEDIILSTTATLEEKNDAYEDLQTINKNESIKEKIEKTIKEQFKLNSIATIDGNNINITIASKTHDTTLANNIIRSIQNLFQDNKYITVKFDI